MQEPTSGHSMERPLHNLKILGESPYGLISSYESYTKIFQGHAGEPDFANAAFTANTRQDNQKYGDFVVARDYREAASKIKSRSVQLTRLSKDGEPRKLCFLFPGYGCQYAGMAHTLYDTSPVFRKHFDYCCDILETQYNIPLKSGILDNENGELVDGTLFGPTGIFTVEYSLLKLWESMGIKPNYVLGHSVGELAAAVAAEFLTIDDAIKLIANTSKLADDLPKGSLLVMLCDQIKAKEILEDNNLDLDIAAMNNKSETVISGDTPNIAQLNGIFDAMNIRTFVFDDSYPGHSRHVDAVLSDYRKISKTVDYKPRENNDVVFISSVSGKVMGDLEADSEYWVNLIRQPVNFVGACDTLAQLPVTDVLEVGPGTSLSKSVLENLGSGKIKAFTSIQLLKNHWEVMLESLGKLYLLGYKIGWEGFDAPYNRKKVTYLPDSK